MNELLKDRLQNPSFMDMEWPRGLFSEALDRIEALEAALREKDNIAYIIDGHGVTHNTFTIIYREKKE
jgi:hypothetical protein